MKIRDGYILRQVAGQHVVIPFGEELDLNMMITLNDTGAFLWKCLEEETTESNLVEAMLEEYEVDRETAQKSVRRYVEELKSNGILA